MAGMDKTAVAAALDVHLNTISAWTNPPTAAARLVRMPTPDKLAALLRVLGWTPEQIQNSFSEFYRVTAHNNGRHPTGDASPTGEAS